MYSYVKTCIITSTLFFSLEQYVTQHVGDFYHIIYYSIHTYRRTIADVFLWIMEIEF